MDFLLLYNLIPCPFHLLTGYDCPFCGAQRMLIAICHGDFASAFGFNPLLFCMIPYFAVLILGQFSSVVRNSVVFRFCNSNKAILSVLVMFAVWGFLRNIL